MPTEVDGVRDNFRVEEYLQGVQTLSGQSNFEILRVLVGQNQ